jgi:hypothetical protein
MTYQGVRYPDFVSATHYGSGDGLCGWNCRHDFWPFWPGLSTPNHTDEELEALNAKTIEYNGELYSEYEISQMQRAAERKVRAAKRTYLAEDAAGQDTTKAAVKLKQARQQLSQFIQDTGAYPFDSSARTSVAGFGRSEASKASALAFRLSSDSSKVAYYSYTDYQEMVKNAVQKSATGARLDLTGKANSIAELLYDDGSVKQRRIYGPDGRSLLDYDTDDHGNPKRHPTGAHKHTYSHSQKNPHGSACPLTDCDLKYNQDIIQEGVNYHATVP